MPHAHHNRPREPSCSTHPIHPSPQPFPTPNPAWPPCAGVTRPPTDISSTPSPPRACIANPSCAARPALRHNITFHATRQPGRTRRLPAVQALPPRPAAARRAGSSPGRRRLPHHRARGRKPRRSASWRSKPASAPTISTACSRRIAGVTPKAYAAAHRQSRVQDAPRRRGAGHRRPSTAPASIRPAASTRPPMACSA